MLATRAFVDTFRGYSSPSRPSSERTARLAEYELFWSYYQNSIFDRAFAGLWDKYKTDQRLVPYLRSLYNPTAKLVDFYVGAVYPGSVSGDGRDLPGGVRSAVPLAKDTSDELKGAVGQLLKWSNWQTTKDLYVTYGAALGDVALEIDDAVDRSKVLLLPRWPGHVVDLDRDDEGNVTFYALEYEVAVDARTPGGLATSTERYIYRKEVDRDVIRTFKDRAPFAYDDVPAEVDNPYGFVPLVWVEHRPRGGDHGAPAIAGSLPKLEAINHLLSILIKDTEKVSLSPKVIATGSTLVPALSPEAVAILDEAEIKLALLKGNENTSVHDIGTNLDIPAILEGVAKIIGFVESDHPEITFYEKLRSMSQVTGPAALRLCGDSESNKTRAASQYDDGLGRGLRMGVSIATIRRKQRAWANDGAAQRMFAPFSPQSFERGELEFDFVSRPLIQETQLEKWTAEKMRADAAVAWQPLLGGSAVLALGRVDIAPDEIAKAFTNAAEAIAAEQRIATSDIPIGQIGDGSVPAQ